jgi:hypothetical protein
MRWRLITIPRTGGVSMAEAYGRGTESGHAHLPAKVFPDEVKLFAVVRNPLDRLISICAYIRGAYQLNLAPREFRLWVCDGCRPDLHDPPQGLAITTWRGPDGLRITSPQTAWLDDRVMLLRFDQLQAAGRRLAAETGQQDRWLPLLNTSKRQPTIEAYYDDRSLDAALERYAGDAALWCELTGADVL